MPLSLIGNRIDRAICRTIKSYSGGAPNLPCVFPFKFKGKMFDRCTWEQSQLTNNKPWCSTMVDKEGNHIIGEAKWGNCSPECPVENDLLKMYG